MNRHTVGRAARALTGLARISHTNAFGLLDIRADKLWGAQKNSVPAYASMIQLSTPEERARMAVQLKSEGWHAIKLRLHYETMREDVNLVATVRKAVGDEMVIMTDAYQAQSATGWQPGVRWDFRRAVETARELEKLNVYWLEEPLPRYDLDGLAELNRLYALRELRTAHGVGLDELAFAARLRSEPALRRAVDGWLAAGDDGGAWIDWEQRKHERLLAA